MMTKAFPGALSWSSKCETQLSFSSCIWCNNCVKLSKREMSQISLFHVCSYMHGRRIQEMFPEWGQGRDRSGGNIHKNVLIDVFYKTIFIRMSFSQSNFLAIKAGCDSNIDTICWSFKGFFSGVHTSIDEDEVCGIWQQEPVLTLDDTYCKRPLSLRLFSFSSHSLLQELNY